MTEKNNYHWEILVNDQKKHCFFGYYDRCPWNKDTQLHLAIRTIQRKRLPLRGETAEIGVVNRKEKKFIKITETRAWCHQQGSMTVWLNPEKNIFSFNDYCVKSQKIISRIWSVEQGECGRMEYPVYAISPDRRYAAGLNFSRIPRRGYSYADAVLDKKPLRLQQDGIFLTRISTRKTNLIVNYERLLDMHPLPYEIKNKHIWLNHIIFNSNSKKLLFLLRHTADTDKPYPWQTYMFTVNIDGSDLRCVLPDVYWRNGTISHQIWGRTPHEILVDAAWGSAQKNEAVVFDERKSPVCAQKLSAGFGVMSHMVFSPDGKQIASDTYPDSRGKQKICLINSSTGQVKTIGYFRHPAVPVIDVRCDLHPRWSADSRLITIDTMHKGLTAIMMCDFKKNEG
ncbi:MAG: hypothetical protein A2096_15605 [Spirochaetes bacterium GWF1_41_5]|nr:MAG: hypothetical protein A2096_15605 [Spirochaetes bacterium GWF1_41_5]HBE04825.1 hypothetical protein [Spirochaetia bacterium]